MPPQKVSPIWNCFIVDPEDSSNAKCKVPAGNRIIRPEPEPEPEFRSGFTGTGLIFRKSGSGFTGTGLLFKRSGPVVPEPEQPFKNPVPVPFQ